MSGVGDSVPSSQTLELNIALHTQPEELRKQNTASLTSCLRFKWPKATGSLLTPLPLCATPLPFCELLSPELRQTRRLERQAAWQLEQANIKSEWPYILNSPTGRALLKQRYKEKISEMRPYLWIKLVAWIIFGWGISSWRTTIIGYIASVPVLFALPIWGEYRRMKRERRDTLLRRGVPDDQI